MGRTLVSILIVLGLALQAHAEGPSIDLFDIRSVSEVPQSPQALRFQEITSPRPALLTGAASFSIPLYTVELDGYSLPLTLEYRSNGIKVLDDPFPVGYGWSLLPSLRVSRQIMGRADGRFEWMGDFEGEWTYDLLYRAMCNSNVMPDNNKIDVAHDIYTIQLPDATIKAVWLPGDPRHFLTASHEEYRFETDSTISYIKVIDPKGIEYMFDVPGECFNEFYNQTEWLLSKITLPTGRCIAFQWREMNHGYQNMAVPIPYITLYRTINAPNISSAELHEDICNPINYFDTSELTGIYFPGGQVSLSYDNYMGSPQLKRVTVSNLTDTLASADLTYSFRSLASVELSDRGTYSMEYNPMDFHTRTSQDWWGYHNGKHNGGTLYPSLTIRKLGIASPITTIGADRSVDAEAMQAQMLMSVTYPSGARTAWEYEPHRFSPRMCPDTAVVSHIADENTLQEGGGLRVRRVLTYESASDPEPQIREYRYGKDGDGLAQVVAVPSKATFVTDKLLVLFDSDRDRGYAGQITVDINSHYLEGHLGETPLWYEEVAEICPEGKTVWKFADIIPPNITQNGWEDFGMFGAINHAFSEGPQLIRKDIYKAQGTAYLPIISENHEYEMCGREYQLRDWQIQREKITYESTCPPEFGYTNIYIGGGCHPPASEEPYYPSRYTTWTKRTQLRSRTVTEYFDNGTEHTVREDYSYVQGTGLLASVSTTVGSGNHTQTTTRTVTYPKGAAGLQTPAAILGAMVARNMVGVPMRTSESFGSDTLLLENVYAPFESSDAGRPNYLASTLASRHNGTPWRTLASYGYDRAANIRSFMGSDSVPTTLLWGHKGRYPVAKITGCAFDSLLAAAGSAVNTLEAEKLTMDLRSYGLCNLYTWKNLVGMTSEVGPAYERVLYTYDSSGRLASASIPGLGLIDSYSYRISPGSNFITHKRYVGETDSKYNTETVHYDGLLRPSVEVTRLAGNLGSTAVLTQYDGMGRPWRRWQAAPVGSTDPDAIISSARSFHADSHPYTSTDYEASPRALPAATTPPGQPWHANGKARRTVRSANTSSGDYSCPRYTVTADALTLTCEGKWPEGLLRVEESVDEDGHRSQVYTDFRGLKVMERRILSDTRNADTRYVHDDRGQLRYVLQPEFPAGAGTWERTSEAVGQYAFYYDYDDLGRITLKAIPGADYVEYRYDPRGRLVAERDGNMRGTPNWLIRLYDRFGRETITYLMPFYSDEIERFCSTSYTVSGSGQSANYPFGLTVTPPLTFTDVTPETITFHDDHTFLDNVPQAMREKLAFLPQSGTIYVPESGRGKVTGRWSAPDNWHVYYYDTPGRVFLERWKDVLPHTLVRTFRPRSEEVSVEELSTESGDSTLYLRTENTYDAAGRLTGTVVTSYSCYDDAMFTTTYDALGRPSKQNYGPSSVTLAYDAAGRVVQRRTNSQAGASTETLHYATGPDGASGFTPCYNGAIARHTLRGHTYDFTYDNMGRLSAARSGGGAADFSTRYTYDLNGNITALVRSGITGRGPGNTFRSGCIDDVRISYQGNVPFATREEGSDPVWSGAPGFFGGERGDPVVTCDANGNLTSDLDRGISAVTYNHLNQPLRITTQSGVRLTHSYDGAGQLLSTTYAISVPRTLSSGKVVYRDSTYMRRSYAGPYVFRTEVAGRVSTTVLEQVRMPGGAFADEHAALHYRLTDYQGNNTMMLTPEGLVEDTVRYYPYGEPIRYPVRGGHRLTAARHLYADKEYEGAGDIREHNFGARRLSTSLPRWTTPDPLCEKYYSISPYAYCAADPINLIDPDGCDTLGIEFLEGVWKISNLTLAQGDDVFTITRDGNTTSVTFSEGEYGKRVNMLNLSVGDTQEDGTIGAFHVSGSDSAYGLFITRGGEPSTDIGSKARIPDGVYPITTPNGSELWRRPGVGKPVTLRGIRFHYGRGVKSTLGCFILSSTYTVKNGKIVVDITDSKNACATFDNALGATSQYGYHITDSEGKPQPRIGSEFPKPITHILNLRTL